MYPHERLLAKKHADKPFVILGVNCEAADRMRQVEAGGAVTWRSWSDGELGPIAAQWNVSSYPTLYLINAQGHVRSKGNLRGEILEAAVETALEDLQLGLTNKPDRAADRLELSG